LKNHIGVTFDFTFVFRLFKKSQSNLVCYIYLRHEKTNKPSNPVPGESNPVPGETAPEINNQN
jgi:hypothetical protein